MAVSKRLRYEILRRDNHACRYCGATAPDTKLTVDHVVPTALGGSDVSTNLVAACDACNSGKTSSSPDVPLVEDVAADALRWARAIKAAAEVQLRQRDDDDGLLERWFDRWERLGLTLYVEHGGSGRVLATLKSLLASGLTEQDLMRNVKVAASASHVPAEDRYRYFCGVCWRQVGQLREIASALIAADGD